LAEVRQESFDKDQSGIRPNPAAVAFFLDDDRD